MSPINSFIFFLAGCNKYILFILITYSTSWLPWVLTFLIHTVRVHAGFHYSRTVSICGQFFLSEREIILQQLHNNTANPLASQSNLISSPVTSSSLAWSTPGCAALDLCMLCFGTFSAGKFLAACSAKL